MGEACLGKWGDNMETNPPLPDDETLRLKEVARYDFPGSPGDPTLEFIANLICDKIGCPIALVTLIDADRQLIKAAAGTELRETPRETSICTHTICEQDYLQVDDLTADPRFRNNRFLVVDASLRSYLGVPIVTPNGFPLGTVCALDTQSHAFSADDRQFLKEIACLAANTFELRLLKHTLGSALLDMEKAEATRTQILSTVSHELRTPLNGVIGALDILNNRQPAIEDAEIISIGRKSANRLYELVDDLIEAANIEYHKHDISPRWFDPARLIRESVTTFAGRTHEGVDLRLAVDVTAPDAIYSDARKLRQVVNHLLSNAVKFTHSGSITVSLDGTADDKLLVRIVDTGPGLAGAGMDRFLKPFIQNEAFLTRRHDGLGLGLSLCDQLCRQMDIDMSIISGDADGTQASLEIPIVAASSNTKTLGDTDAE